MDLKVLTLAVQALNWFLHKAGIKAKLSMTAEVVVVSFIERAFKRAKIMHARPKYSDLGF
jgi:hypothetical protein